MTQRNIIKLRFTMLEKGFRKELEKTGDLEVLGRCMVFWEKLMAPACLSRWCGWFLFLDLRKNIYKKKVTSNQRSIHAFRIRIQMCIHIIEGNTKGLRRGVIHTRHCPFITPLYFLLWSGCTTDLEGMDASLIRRNFFSCKYFFANPKIKIVRIIEINTLVAIKLRSCQSQ